MNHKNGGNIMKPIKKLTLSAAVIALYVVIMMLTQSFSFQQYQIRIATSLYSLSYIFPFLIVPLGIANLLSNAFMGGLGIFDIVGGILVGIITSGTVYIIKRLKLNKWLIMLPLILGPGLIVPIWLSGILHTPYYILAISLCIGQILPAFVGVFLVKGIERIPYFSKLRK